MSKMLFEHRYSVSQIQLSWELIKTSKNITLLTHANADGDGVSACAALDHILRKIGKNVECIYPDNPEFDYKRQPQTVLIGRHIQIPDLLISCDVATRERFYWSDEFKNKPMINIDHHVSNNLYAEYNFINADSSSACEELLVVMHEWDQSLIDKYVAECLLFGILYDSQIFQIHPLHPKTLDISACLMRLGANIFDLEKELLSNKNPQIFMFWGKVLGNIKFTQSGKTAWTSVRQKDLKDAGLSLSSLIGFNNMLSQISDIDVTILFYEREDGKTKVSLRSKITDVNKFAKIFNGGGHANAAGISSDKPIDQVIEMVTSQI